MSTNVAESSGMARASHVAARHSQRSSFDQTHLDDLHLEGSIPNGTAEDDDEKDRLLDPDDLDSYELDDLDPLADEANKAAEPEDNSPYPEVRAAVRNYDEDVPCSTVRAWTIGLSLVLVGASMNTLFSLRHPTISVTSLLAQVVAYPIGHAWAAVMPSHTFTTFGRRWSLNPGPFNIKEHAVIVVMASVSFQLAYSTDVILAQLIFYKQDFGLLFQLLLTICTQSLGFGMAGVMRKFLVYPASMIWPINLVNVSLMNAMHDKHDTRDPSVFGGRMSRYRWFTIISAISFIYFFVPGYLAKCLSVFAPLTWLAPQNAIVNQLFGGTTGLAMIPITFDWSQVSGYVGSPLTTPWKAIANTLLGVLLFFSFLVPVLHYTGTWYAPYLPISDARTFDNLGKTYNTTRVLNPDFTLNEEAYKAYSPLFISTSFAVTYGLSFAAITSLIVYTYLHNGKTIWKQYRHSANEKPDVHMRLMRKYPETPTWWYGSLFVIMLALSFYTVLGYPTNMSWWAFLLAIFISFSFMLPVGIIEAVTNSRIGLNVLTEFVYGYVEPGRPLALMLFKTYGYISMSQALSFISDLKFGHYMKVPPRTMFLAQVISTLLSCVVQVVVLNFALVNIDNVCDLEQVDRFTCPGGRVFFSASVIWGLIGPARMFNPGQIYFGLFIFFIIGAITPIVIYKAGKRWPKTPIKHLMAPLIFGGAGAIPPATPLNYFSWGIVGFVFQSWIKRKHNAWWMRLNFLTSCGLDFGLALGTFILFFAFTIHNIAPPRWWGNTVVESTMDYQGTAIRMKVADGTKFGPAGW